MREGLFFLEAGGCPQELPECPLLLASAQGGHVCQGSHEGKTIAFKNELLFSRNINFNDLPNWQKRGVGLYYSSYEKKGYNPVKDEEVTSIRSRLNVNMELEIGEAYTDWVISQIPQD